jgi:Relaxase/Mobilisation nuclease domain.
MSVVIIEKVKDLKRQFQYCMQDSKTNDQLITTFGCNKETAYEEFNDIYRLREKRLRKETKNKARVIYQSFNPDDNVSAELAHKIGVEFAENYLQNKHQYIVYTHIDTDVIHNHIVFNEVRTDNLLMFDTKRTNTLTRLRAEDDKLSKKYNLSVNNEIKKDKNKRVTQKEYVVKARGLSFKQKLENQIDDCIIKSNSYDEFLKNMEMAGYPFKKGMYLSFLNKSSNKFMRSRTLGFNYTENSIKYRIENKEFNIEKIPYLLKKQWIDKREEKYQLNYGLSKWATKQNLEYLQELSKLVINKKMTIEEILQQDRDIRIHYQSVQKNIDSIDYELRILDKMTGCFNDYKNSHTLMQNYKIAKNKQEFKKNNYNEFKKYDIAKKQIYLLKKKYNIDGKEELENLRAEMYEDRSILYKELNEKMKKDIENRKHKI